MQMYANIYYRITNLYVFFINIGRIIRFNLYLLNAHVFSTTNCIIYACFNNAFWAKFACLHKFLSHSIPHNRFNTWSNGCYTISTTHPVKSKRSIKILFHSTSTVIHAGQRELSIWVSLHGQLSHNLSSTSCICRHPLTYTENRLVLCTTFKEQFFGENSRSTIPMHWA